MNIFLKTEDEIAKMRRANQLVGATLAELAKHIKPGVTTLQLDTIAEEFIRDHGAIPTFKNFPNPIGGSFPASICTSINAIVVHGIPSDKVVSNIVLLMVSEKREKDDVVEVIIFEKIFSGLKPIIAITAPASNNEAMIAPMRISVSATRETPARSATI